FDPEAGFNVGNAMSRNKAIYALANYGVVVSSGYNEGGTWSGALEQLEKFKFVPVFVRSAEDAPEGNKRLLKKGALPLANPPWQNGIRETFELLVEESRENVQRSPVQ